MNTSLALKTLPLMISLALAGCGGGGGGTSTNTAVLSGTAATGAAIQGTVTVKDSAGATRSVAVGSDGKYSIDVSGMTAPFMLKVEGVSGGKSYMLYSFAAGTDVNGTVNVTPLTSLVVANAAGQAPGNLYVGGTFQTALNSDKIASAENVLRARLASMLSAAGLSANVDLMHAPFNADHTGMDAALDSMKVSFGVDASTGKPVARIQEIYGGNYIDDDLSTDADQSGLQAPADVQAGLQALQDIIAQFRALQAKFATGMPSTSDTSFTDLFDASFMDDGGAKTDFTAAWAGASDMQGVEFKRIAPVSIDPANGTAVVAFTVKQNDGRWHQELWTLRKGTDGKWRFAGDQRATAVSLAADSQLNAADSGIATGIEIKIQRPATTKVDYATVKGPGLPASGALLVNYAGSDDFSVSAKTAYDGTTPGTADAANVGKDLIALTDADIGTIADNSDYTVTLYNDNGTPTNLADDTVAGSYTLVLPKRPYKAAELQVANFPAIGTDYLSQIQNYTGSAAPLQFGWAMPDDIAPYRVDYARADSTGATSTLSIPVAPGAASAGVQYASGAYTVKSLSLEGRDEYGRKRTSTYVFPMPSNYVSPSPTAPASGA